MEWTNNLVIKLVQQYEARPMLWNPNHELFRILSAKIDAWEELSTNFDIEISDLKKKVQSVLASHRRENGRVKAGGRSNWFLYPYMKFLPNHIGCSDETVHADYETETVRISNLYAPSLILSNVTAFILCHSGAAFG